MTDEILTDISVECHSGYIYAERPRAFQLEGEHLEIKTIIAEWQTPENKHFRVITKCGQTFELVYDFTRDDWQVYQEEQIK